MIKPAAQVRQNIGTANQRQLSRICREQGQEIGDCALPRLGPHRSRALPPVKREFESIPKTEPRAIVIAGNDDAVCYIPCFNTPVSHANPRLCCGKMTFANLQACRFLGGWQVKGAALCAIASKRRWPVSGHCPIQTQNSLQRNGKPAAHIGYAPVYGDAHPHFATLQTRKVPEALSRRKNAFVCLVCELCICSGRVRHSAHGVAIHCLVCESLGFARDMLYDSARAIAAA